MILLTVVLGLLFFREELLFRESWFTSIATDGSGVQKYDGEKFTHYDVEDGVGAGETFSIYVDDFDMVWVGTFSGLSLIHI